MTSCSFCHQPEGAGRRLIAGPSIWICTACIDLATTMLTEDVGAGGLERHARTAAAVCSFCGQRDRFVVTGPRVAICAACIAACTQELAR
jgi:ATP-dependent protease Clp ATPase subunit